MVLARRLILVLVVLTALGGSAAYFTTEMGLAGDASRAENLGWWVFALMASLSILLAILIWRTLSASFRQIRRQLRQFEDDDEIGMIMIDERDDLAELVACINRYLTRLKSRFQQDQEYKRELEIQARVAEAERRQTEAVIFSICEAVLVTDSFDEIRLVNPAAEALFGFRLEEVYRRPVDEVLPDPELLELVRQVRRPNHHNKPIHRLWERPDPDSGKTISWKLFVSGVLDAGRDLIGVVIIIHDVTAEKEIERLKDDFISSVSHELKTPLSSIRAYAELLADREARKPQDYQRFCEVILEQSQRLNRLIDNILHSCRLETGDVQVSRRRLDLVALVRGVLTALEPQAREKQIQLQARLAAEPIWIEADHDMITQAIMNLVGNALKYSRSSSAVQVRLGTTPSQEALVEIEDQGIGIPAEAQDRIFEKFYRVRQDSQIAGGTGLGLYLARRIIETVHRGRIAVSSRPGQGSLFTVTLPVSCAQQPAPV